MSWLPNTIIKINGVAKTSYTIEGVSLSMGRTDITQQSPGGFASIQMLDYPSTDVTLNDIIVVQIENYSGTPITIFTGYVTDFTTQVLESGKDKVTFITDIVATSALSKLGIKEINKSGYPEQKDGDRILAILDEAYATSWDELPATKIWTDYTTETWADLRGYDSTYIDTPGTYDLYAEPALPTNGYLYASVVADSGVGQLFETTDGLIGYADQDHRADYLTANGFLNIPSTNVLSDGISVQTSRNNLTNDVIVSYDPDSLTVEVSDPTSIDTYGKVTTNIETYLKNEADALTVGQRAVLLNAYPAPILQNIGVQIDAPTMTESLLNGLVGVFFGQPISIDDIPSLLYPTGFFGYVEGWSWNINRFNARLDLNVSDFRFYAVPVAWQDVYAGETWDTIEPTLDWANALLGVN